MKQQLINLQVFISNLLDWFYKPFRKIIPAQTFRYAAMGGLNTFLDIFLYFICYNYVVKKEMVDLGFVVMSAHIASFVFVFPIPFTTGFLAAKYITFTSSSLRGRVQLFRYALIVVGAIVLNYVFLKIFVEILFIWPTVAKILTTLFVVTYSYIVQTKFAFKSKKLT
jgi:putative flippase GtrA